MPEGALRQNEHTRAVSSLKPSEREKDTASSENGSQAGARSVVGTNTLLARSREELKKEKSPQIVMASCSVLAAAPSRPSRPGKLGNREVRAPAERLGQPHHTNPAGQASSQPGTPWRRLRIRPGCSGGGRSSGRRFLLLPRAAAPCIPAPSPALEISVCYLIGPVSREAQSSNIKATCIFNRERVLQRSAAAFK